MSKKIGKIPDNDFLIKLGARIHDIRKVQTWGKGKNGKVSQSELGELIGVHQHVTIGQIERGEENCTVLTLKKIADALGVTVSELMDF